MTKKCKEAIRLIGCLRIKIKRLKTAIDKNDLADMEALNQEMQDAYLELTKLWYKLSFEEKRFVELRSKIDNFGAFRLAITNLVMTVSMVVNDALRAFLTLKKVMNETPPSENIPHITT